MNGNNIENIVRSNAFTILIATVCLLLVMDRLPVVIKAIKEVSQSD